MAGYQGTLSPDPFKNGPKQNALAGSEYMPEGWVSENPQKDEALRRTILDQLEAHVELNASEIEVEVKDGFVSLSGMAKSDDDKATIEALVESTDGVKDVTSLIEIDSISDVFRSLSGVDDLTLNVEETKHI